MLELSLSSSWESNEMATADKQLSSVRARSLQTWAMLNDCPMEEFWELELCSLASLGDSIVMNEDSVCEFWSANDVWQIGSVLRVDGVNRIDGTRRTGDPCKTEEQKFPISEFLERIWIVLQQIKLIADVNCLESKYHNLPLVITIRSLISSR